MKCPKCGNENNDSAKFCKDCGAEINSAPINTAPSQTDKARNKKIIITSLIVVIIILAGIVVYASGILTPDLPMQTQEFDGFTIDVPVGSNFVLEDQSTTNSNHIGVFYCNKGNYEHETYALQVGNAFSEQMIVEEAKLIENNGTVKIYDLNDTYELYGDYGTSQILLIGNNLKALKHMADSYKEKDLSKLYSESTFGTSSSTGSSQATQSSAPTTPMSILGGSFSTGSGSSDKTYAKINVGSEHAGESVIIQIYYSRDGSTLNNGNMVPKTVTSDGYIEVASAEPYSKYPDFAEINLYDSSNNLMDSVTVNLSPESGTQSF